MAKSTIKNNINVEDLTNDIVAKSGYTILSCSLKRSGRTYCLNCVVKKNSGNFGNSAEIIGEFTNPIFPYPNINSGCYVSSSEWGANDVGYLYIGSSIHVSTNATNCNIAKIATAWVK